MSVLVGPVDAEEEFYKWMEQFWKTYDSEEEEQIRFKIFESNLQSIVEHNERFQAGDETYSKKLNQFADLTSDEVPKGTGGPVDAQEEFSKWMEQFSKTYESEEEKQIRFGIFESNLQSIVEHNKRFQAGDETYSKKLNQFADLTSDEVPKGTGQDCHKLHKCAKCYTFD